MTDPAEKPAIARNVLTNAALIRLTDWARQNVEACQTLSNKTLATMAGETLNLHLTAANIASALEAVNITKIKPKAPPTLEERVTKMEFDTDAYLAAYGARLNALEKQMRKLETESAAVTSRLLRALENIGAIQPPTSSEMVYPGQTLHGLPDLDVPVAQVKAEREQNSPTFERPPIDQAYAIIADNP